MTCQTVFFDLQFKIPSPLLSSPLLLELSSTADIISIPVLSPDLNAMASITQFIAQLPLTDHNLITLSLLLSLFTLILAIHTAILQPDEFTIKGQQYIQCSSLTRHRRTQRSGFPWSRPI